MHYWPNPSIIKRMFSMSEFRSKRPKGLKDDEWNAMVAERLLDKQTLLDCVPKISKAATERKAK